MTAKRQFQHTAPAGTFAPETRQIAVVRVSVCPAVAHTIPRQPPQAVVCVVHPLAVRPERRPRHPVVVIVGVVRRVLVRAGGVVQLFGVVLRVLCRAVAEARLPQQRPVRRFLRQDLIVLTFSSSSWTKDMLICLFMVLLYQKPCG